MKNSNFRLTTILGDSQQKTVNLPNCVLCLLDRPQSKMKSEKREKCLDLARELKKIIEDESDSDTICNRCAWYSHQWIGKGTGRIGNKNTSGDHANDSTVKIGQNTEKSPGDVRRLAVTQI